MPSKTDYNLMILLILNAFMFASHIYVNCQSVFYFFQLTIIAQTLVILNFALSIVMHERKSAHSTRKFLSRFHLVTLSLEAIVVIGFWGLRIFFTKGIIDPDQQYTIVMEILSVWVHGGAFVTMFYFIKKDQIVLETKKRKKFLFHSFWGVPFVFLQYLHWYLTGEHVYGFLKYFSWTQLIVFELSLLYIAISIDYSLNIRHGLKLSLKHIKSNKTSIEELQIQKEIEEAQKQIEEDRAKSATLKKAKAPKMKRNKSVR